MYITMCKIEEAISCCIVQEAQSGTLGQSRGVGRGGGREGQQTNLFKDTGWITSALL